MTYSISISIPLCFIVNEVNKRILDFNPPIPNIHLVVVILPFHLDWKSPCRGEGAFHQEVSTQVRQREELNWASQLKSSDQQIFSTMSSTDSTLIRQRLGRPSLVKAPLVVQRQSAYVLAVHLVTVRLLAAAGRLLRLVKRKVATPRAFTVGF